MSATRRERRSRGKRDLKRACRADVIRVLEHAAEGYSPKTIASSVGLTVALVNEVLARAAEVKEGGGGLT